MVIDCLVTSIHCTSAESKSDFASENKTDDYIKSHICHPLQDKIASHNTVFLVSQSGALGYSEVDVLGSFPTSCKKTGLDTE